MSIAITTAHYTDWPKIPYVFHSSLLKNKSQESSTEATHKNLLRVKFLEKRHHLPPTIGQENFQKVNEKPSSPNVDSTSISKKGPNVDQNFHANSPTWLFQTVHKITIVRAITQTLWLAHHSRTLLAAKST